MRDDPALRDPYISTALQPLQQQNADMVGHCHRPDFLWDKLALPGKMPGDAGPYMNNKPDAALLESLARDAQAPLERVHALYEREREALERDATVPNFITLLAVRRVRDQLLADGGR
jgi:hypothetical protein